MGDDFGVGLRFKGVNQGFEAFAFGFLEVFDDAVVNQRQSSAGDVWGWALGSVTLPLGRPAGMADADIVRNTPFRAPRPPSAARGRHGAPV